MSRSASPSPGTSEFGPFTPLAFLRVAATIDQHELDEALLRMAVGRTYYGLFLVAREQLGIVASRGVHDAVSRELATRELGDLGSKIGQLRSVRELADYQLVPSNPRWRDWTWNWRYVRRIANSAVKEMVSIGWITEPIVFPTD